MHCCFSPRTMDLSAYLQAKLAELSYDDPSAVEYIVGIILEESLEEEDKLEAIIGILDADPEDRQSFVLLS